MSHARRVARREIRSLAVVQTVSPDYRTRVWNELIAKSRGRARIYAGKSFFDPSTAIPVDVPSSVCVIRNFFMLRRRIAFQALPLETVHAEVVIAEANPRVLTTWLLLGLRQLLRRPTLLWGHVASKRLGRRSSALSAMMRLCNGYICYTRSDAAVLIRDRSFRHPVFVAPNAVASAEAMAPRPQSDATNFVYVGRMISAKKPDLLLDGFLRAAATLPGECHLVMAGSGPLLSVLQTKAAASPFSARVRFTGHIFDGADLDEIYSGALASVSPGYVGLSVIQSFGFGVPMIVADREPHSPEIEAVHLDLTGTEFTAGSVDALAAALRSVWDEREIWYARAPHIVEMCAREYSVEGLGKALWTAAETVAEGSRRNRSRPG